MDALANARPYWLHALGPLHVGAGRGVDFIDLPVMRKKTTGWPIVPGSTVKGVLRAQASGPGADRRLLQAAFGYQEQQSGNAGALVFSDARLVALPVRSFFGTFAYCTSHLALRRLKRDLATCAVGAPEPPLDNGRALLAEQSVLPFEKAIWLEDLDVPAEQGVAQEWAAFLASCLFPQDLPWRRLFPERFAILPEAQFNFLAETATEVAARVRLDDNRSVVSGALWYEESLPAETVLAGFVWCDRVFAEDGPPPDSLLHAFCGTEQLMQVGGKASTGKGLVRCVFGPLPQ